VFNRSVRGDHTEDLAATLDHQRHENYEARLQEIECHRQERY
jgi:hypothetical protein